MSQVNRVHKRALRTVYDDHSISLEALLDLENTVNIHTKHLQMSMTETFKTLRQENPQCGICFN